MKGRKRHILVDSLGLLLGVVVTEANASERLMAAVGLMELGDEISSLEVIWVDSGYRGQNLARVVRAICGAHVEVIQRIESGFQVLPKRWVVERTFAWFGRNRRLSKDYELLPEVSEAMIYTSMVRLMLKRLTA